MKASQCSSEANSSARFYSVTLHTRFAQQSPVRRATIEGVLARSATAKTGLGVLAKNIPAVAIFLPL